MKRLRPKKRARKNPQQHRLTVAKKIDQAFHDIGKHWYDELIGYVKEQNPTDDPKKVTVEGLKGAFEKLLREQDEAIHEFKVVISPVLPSELYARACSLDTRIVVDIPTGMMRHCIRSFDTLWVSAELYEKLKAHLQVEEVGPFSAINDAFDALQRATDEKLNPKPAFSHTPEGINKKAGQ